MLPGIIENLPFSRRNHMLGTLDFTGSELWATFSFFLEHSLAVLLSVKKMFSQQLNFPQKWSVLFPLEVWVSKVIPFCDLDVIFTLPIRFIATPFVRYLGVQDKPSVFVPNTFCEKVYQTISKSPNAERIEGLTKQLGWTTREVKRWFKNRRQQSKPSLMRKATESR